MTKRIRNAIPPELGLRINRMLVDGDGDDLLDILADLIGNGTLVVSEPALKRFTLFAQCTSPKQN